MAIRMILFSAAAAMVLAAPAFAGSSRSSSALSTGGNTIAGPGVSRAEVEDVDTLVDSVSEDVCVTMSVKKGKSSTDVRLDLTDGDLAVSSLVVGSGTTAALCQNDNDTIQATCVGPTRCEYSWRVDRK